MSLGDACHVLDGLVHLVDKTLHLARETLQLAATGLKGCDQIAQPGGQIGRYLRIGNRDERRRHRGSNHCTAPLMWPRATTSGTRKKESAGPDTARNRRTQA